MSAPISASVLHGARDLRIEEQNIEPPGPYELQLAIKATTLCGSDLHYYQHYRNGDIYVKEPISLGHESAGIVVSIGARAKDFEVGDHVALEVGIPCGKCDRCLEGRYNICPEMSFRSSAKSFPHAQGTLQERVNHPAVWCHKLPDSVSLEMGALLEPLSVAIHATRRGKVSKGQKILVIGAGAVGLLCAAMCKVHKSGKIVIADVQDGRVAFAKLKGFADHGYIVDRTRGKDMQEKLKIARETATSAMSAGDASASAFDVVLECTGVESCTQAAIYATRPGGKVVIVGMGNPVQMLPISAAALREVDIVGTFRYANAYPEAIDVVSRQPPALPDLSNLITHRYKGLQCVDQAFQAAGRSTDDLDRLILKVLVECD